MKNKNHHLGFSLAETVVAILLLALIVLLVFSMYLMGQKSYRQSDDRAELTQNGRIILDRLERELRQAQQLVTVLPEDNSNPAVVPHEIIFQDGHNTDTIRYIRYYLAGTDFKRQIITYHFITDPSLYVHYNDTDAFGQSPIGESSEDYLMGEFVTTLDFYGNGITTIALQLTKNNKIVNLLTKFYGRNL